MRVLCLTRTTGAYGLFLGSSFSTSFRSFLLVWMVGPQHVPNILLRLTLVYYSSVQLPWPIHKIHSHLSVHHRLRDGRIESCGILCQHRHHHERSLRWEPRPLRWNASPLQSGRDQTCCSRSQNLRMDHEEGCPPSCSACDKQHQRVVLWEQLHW